MTAARRRRWAGAAEPLLLNPGETDHFDLPGMENRWFDHMVGYLSRDRNRANANDLIGNEWSDGSTGTPPQPRR